MGHDHVIEASGSLVAGVLVFVAGWQVMVAAMMLPSSLPAIGWFRSLDGVAEAPHRRTGAFLAGYAWTWTLVGAAALAGDVVVHDVSHRFGWVEARPWLIASAALATAGAFELSQVVAPMPRERRGRGPRSRPGSGGRWNGGRAGASGPTTPGSVCATAGR